MDALLFIEENIFAASQVEVGEFSVVISMNCDLIDVLLREPFDESSTESCILCEVIILIYFILQ